MCGCAHIYTYIHIYIVLYLLLIQLLETNSNKSLHASWVSWCTPVSLSISQWSESGGSAASSRLAWTMWPRTPIRNKQPGRGNKRRQGRVGRKRKVRGIYEDAMLKPSMTCQLKNFQQWEETHKHNCGDKEHRNESNEVEGLLVHVQS